MTIRNAEISQAATRMAKSTNKTPPPSTALVAGIGLLIMVIAAPIAELYVFPRLIVLGDAGETVRNIVENQALFIGAIFGYLIAFICDVLVAWALYIYLKPVNESYSLLTAWFRLVYTVIALVALLNLVTVLRLLNTSTLTHLFQPVQLQAQMMLALNTFRSEWYFGLLFFGIHLGLLGYLVFISKYIPKILGVLLIIAGAGYLLTALKPFLFPDINIAFAEFTYYGELIFMLWLLIKGSRMNESNEDAFK
jgi:uncharacterized protein DUF4386